MVKVLMWVFDTYLAFCGAIITMLLINYGMGYVTFSTPEPVSCSCVCDDCQCGPDGWCGCQFCEHGGKR